jgi:hypothetical protein
MSARLTWIKGKMHFPPDVDPADVDWEPLDGRRSTTETEQKKEEDKSCK